jgi:type II secretion system protein H
MVAPQRQAGFTLVELVVLLLIMAMLASMAIPRFASASARYRVDAAARRVAADLTLACRNAYQSSSSRTVTFNVGADSYELSHVGDLDRPAENYEVSLAGEPHYATIVSADFAGQTKIAFNGFGVPVGIEGSAGTVVIRVGDEVRTVVLDGTTGEVAILAAVWTLGDPVDPSTIVGGNPELPAFDG